MNQRRPLETRWRMNAAESETGRDLMIPGGGAVAAFLVDGAREAKRAAPFRWGRGDGSRGVKVNSALSQRATNTGGARLRHPFIPFHPSRPS